LIIDGSAQRSFMKKSLVISEYDSIAAVLENEKVVEFFVNRGELLLGDIYSATVENILPGIDAAFVNLGKDKMGFLHANDVPGQGPLKERLVPKQKLLVQITKEPTGHKGPRVSTAISLPGRFLVLVPEERGVSISRRISEARERARLKSVVNLMKPPGIGLIIRTEAKGQGEQELFEDFEQLWDRWQTVVSEGEASIGPTLIYRDQDLLFRVIRDAYSHEVSDIIVDTADGQHRAQEYLQGWASKTTKVSHHAGDENILVARGIDKEIEAALSDRVELPSGGHLVIQPTEALTVIDVNSGRFTSSRTQAETVRRTNLEASQEIARQLRLRNIGGMVIVDFIDMDSRRDQQQVLEVFQRVLEDDRAKPQCGQLSDLGLVELTRRRQGQSLRELFTVHCSSCSGLGVMPTLEIGHAEHRRVITFKSKDDDNSKGRGSRRGGMKQQPGVLRAATASNGRIMPTVEVEPEEDALSFVPEDILEQMPDDLLQSKEAPAAFNKYSGHDEEDELEENEEPVVQTHSRPANYAADRPYFSGDDSDESELSNSLSESISEVEQVYQDMGARRQASEAEEAEEAGGAEVDIEDVVVIASHSVDQAETEVEAEAATEEKLEAPEVESPYETEVDPVTGVYRLKAKAPTASLHEAEHDGAEHHHHAHESHAHESHSTEGGVGNEEDWEGTQLQIPVYGQPEGDEVQQEQQQQSGEHGHEHHEQEGEDQQQHGHEHHQTHTLVENNDEQQNDQDSNAESESQHMQPSWNS
jgi:Rne/Rng family ribonuclease